MLVQFQDIATSEWSMAAYKVEATRTGGGNRITDLFPQLDPETHLPVDVDGVPVEQPADPMYDFDYTAFAGDVYIPPYPVNTVVGNVVMANNAGGNVEVDGVQQRTLWNDKNRTAWVVSGDGRLLSRELVPAPGRVLVRLRWQRYERPAGRHRDRLDSAQR